MRNNEKPKSFKYSIWETNTDEKNTILVKNATEAMEQVKEEPRTNK